MTGGPPSLLALTERHDARIVDVRYVPQSRAAQWNRGPLARVLGDRYFHLQALGNVNYKEPAKGIRLMDLDAGIAAMRAVLSETPAILLCACKSLASCHRLTAAEGIHAALKLDVLVHLLAGDDDYKDLPKAPPSTLRHLRSVK